MVLMSSVINVLFKIQLIIFSVNEHVIFSSVNGTPFLRVHFSDSYKSPNSTKKVEGVRCVIINQTCYFKHFYYVSVYFKNGEFREAVFESSGI